MDIVEKLRSLDYPQAPFPVVNGGTPVARLAADEIERLRRDLDAADKSDNSARDLLNDIEAIAALLIDAVMATEKLDNRDDCPECEGEGEPEKCPLCFPWADEARLKRRAALAKAEAQHLGPWARTG